MLGMALLLCCGIASNKQDNSKTATANELMTSCTGPSVHHSRSTAAPSHATLTSKCRDVSSYPMLSCMPLTKEDIRCSWVVGEEGDCGDNESPPSNRAITHPPQPAPVRRAPTAPCSLQAAYHNSTQQQSTITRQRHSLSLSSYHSAIQFRTRTVVERGTRGV